MPTLEETIKTYTDSSNPDILGVVLLAVDATGKELYHLTSGRISLDEDAKPITPDSVLRLASCTKLITTLAVLRLAQAGQVSLDDAELVERHLPELAALQVLTGGPEPENFVLKKREKPITLRHLLTHSSGAVYDVMDPRLQAWQKATGAEAAGFTGPVVEGFSFPLTFEPGEGWMYGPGLDWAGLLVERISGVSLGTYMRREIFDPLGCDAGIGFREEEVSKSAEIVQTVERPSEEEGGPLKPWTPWEMKADMGGGALMSSSANYLRILQDIIRPESKLLEKKWLDELFASSLAEGGPAHEALKAAAPVVGLMTAAVTSALKGVEANHALGGIVLTGKTAAGRPTRTMSWGGAFNSLWAADREEGIATWYGSSMYPPAGKKDIALQDEFMQEVWGKVSK